MFDILKLKTCSHCIDLFFVKDILFSICSTFLKQIFILSVFVVWGNQLHPLGAKCSDSILHIDSSMSLVKDVEMWLEKRNGIFIHSNVSTSPKIPQLNFCKNKKTKSEISNILKKNLKILL